MLMTSKHNRESTVMICHVIVCISAPVVTSPPPPTGEVVKYSSQATDHIVPSQDIQGDSFEQSLFREFVPLCNDFK